jgi:hypothetical protein
LICHLHPHWKSAYGQFAYEGAPAFVLPGSSMGVTFGQKHKKECIDPKMPAIRHFARLMINAEAQGNVL